MIGTPFGMDLMLRAIATNRTISHSVALTWISLATKSTCNSADFGKKGPVFAAKGTILPGHARTSKPRSPVSAKAADGFDNWANTSA